MQFSLALLAGLAATTVSAQGVTGSIPPPSGPPPGCQLTYPGSFQVTTLNATGFNPSKMVKRQGAGGNLQLTLNNGVLKNQQGATGYIAANRQFQFDNPPQTGAIFTSGFSACGNGTLAIGGSTIFYSCNSGGFNNLYDQSQGQQCSQVFISVVGGGSGGGSGSSSSSSSASVSASSTSAVTQTSDRQPQGPTTAPTATRSTSTSKVTQISDQQPQAGTSAASPRVTQISDQQPQAATSAPTPKSSPVFNNGAAAAPTGMAQLALAGAGAAVFAML